MAAVTVNPVKRSFEVEKVVDQGQAYGKARHYVVVKFHDGGHEAFHCQSPSLEVSFEMIEAFAQQVKGNKNFINEVEGQSLYFCLNENKETGDTEAISYRLNRYGVKLENTFDPKNPRFTYSKIISRDLQEELKRLAKAQNQSNPRPFPPTVRINLEKEPTPNGSG